MKRFLLALLLAATQANAAPLTIVPNGPPGIVTAGIPFQACALTDINSFRLLDDAGAEVPAFVKPTLFWPANRCNGAVSIRAIKLQFNYPDTVSKVYSWGLTGKTLAALPEAPIAEVVSTNPAKAPFKEPVAFVINDPAYLVTTGLIPPTTVAGANDHDTVWYPTAFNKRVTTTSFATTGQNDWLFDAVSSIYQQAFRSGKVEQYREAYLEHEFWISRMEVVTGSIGKPATATSPAVPPIPNFCIGGFDLDGVARPYSEGGQECDGKYTYLTPMKLHLALTGDDSWRPEENGVPVATAKDIPTIIDTIAKRAFTSDWTRTCGLIAPYTNTACAFTERNVGFALQQMLGAYELTGNATALANLTTAIDNLLVMIRNNPDGMGNNGYLSHSWHAHEGWYPAFIGTLPEAVTSATTLTIANLLNDDWKLLAAGTEIQGRPYGSLAKLTSVPTRNTDGTLTLTLDTPVTMRAGEAITIMSTAPKSDRAFNPWMQSIIADALWQLYNLTGDTALQSKISEILLGFGRAITAHAVDGNGLSPAIKTQIDSAFGVRVVSSSTSGSRGIVPYTRYVANVLMSGPTGTKEYVDYLNYDGAFADQHTPEALFQLSLAIQFETDPAKKAAMQSVASALTGWFSSANISRTILGSHPPRYFNWTNKPNAWGTYQYVMGQTSPPVTPPPVVPPPVVVPPPAPPVSGALTFVNDTAAIDRAPFVDFHMWAGDADVNNDGCFDLYNGNHMDTKNSAMYINDCSGKFAYYFTQTFSQGVPQYPRVTSENWFANLTNNALGLPSMTGADADRIVTALYEIDSLVDGKPVYKTKAVGCQYKSCIPIDRDGEVALMTRDAIHSVSGTKLASLDTSFVTGAALLYFDVNKDSYGDRVYPLSKGYALYNPETKSYDWQPDKFAWANDIPPILLPCSSRHMVPLDFDNDADLDIYIGCATYDVAASTVQGVLKGPNLFYTRFFRNDNGNFVETTSEMGLSDTLLRNTFIYTTYANSIPVDLDLDGYKDILYCAESRLHRPTDGYAFVTLLRNSAGKLIPDRTNNFREFSGPNSSAGRPRCGTVDYDNDGKEDIIKTAGQFDSTHESIAIWRNTTATSNHYLRARVQGKTTDGLGAAITVKRAGTSQVLCYEQVGMFNSGLANLAPHCGLGTADKVDVTVRYPNDGPTYTHTNLDADQDIILRIDGSIVTNYTPGINPLLAVADGTAPPVEPDPIPDPIPDPEPEPNIQKLLEEIEMLEAEAVQAQAAITQLQADKDALTVTNTSLLDANTSLIIDKEALTANLATEKLKLSTLTSDMRALADQYGE